MSRVLIMSSWTAVGDVGLSIAAPLLQSLGHIVTQLPTVILSNHPGRPHHAGRPVPPEQLAAMIDAIDANGWLHNHDAVLTGYMPTLAHVTIARDLVARLREAPSAPLVVIDPILGDDPGGLFINEQVARAIRDELVPIADVVTPNRFELAWLTGRAIATLTDVLAAAGQFTRGSEKLVLVTSPPMPGDKTGVVAIGSRADIALFQTPRIANVPHGVGDAFSALVAARLPVGAALGYLWALIQASAGDDCLAVVASANAWRVAPALKASVLPASRET